MTYTVHEPKGGGFRVIRDDGLSVPSRLGGTYVSAETAREAIKYFYIHEKEKGGGGGVSDEHRSQILSR